MDDTKGFAEEVFSAFNKFTRLTLIAAILQKLRLSLPSHLCYHSYEHTADVLKEVLTFALEDHLSEREQELLAIAAAYHDAGFLKQESDNERLGAEMAKAAMREAGSYSEDEIREVYKMILDTQLLEGPDGPFRRISTRLSHYLLDADLSNLGREDFLERNALYAREQGLTEEQAGLSAKRLLAGHHWLTPAGRRLRTKRFQQNIKELGM